MNICLDKFRVFGFFTIFLILAGSLSPSHASGTDKGLQFDQAHIKIIHSYDMDSPALSYTVELAITMDQRAQGLMFRHHMAADQGMLFFFEQEKQVTMWMKNTYIPLDLLFLNKRGEIVNIAASAKPLSLDFISSGVPVISVLELNAGEAKRQNIKVGDRVIHSFFTKN